MTILTPTNLLIFIAVLVVANFLITIYTYYLTSSEIEDLTIRHANLKERWFEDRCKFNRDASDIAMEVDNVRTFCQSMKIEIDKELEEMDKKLNVMIKAARRRVVKKDVKKDEA